MKNASLYRYDFSSRLLANRIAGAGLTDTECRAARVSRPSTSASTTQHCTGRALPWFGETTFRQ